MSKIIKYWDIFASFKSVEDLREWVNGDISRMDRAIEFYYILFNRIKSEELADVLEEYIFETNKVPMPSNYAKTPKKGSRRYDFFKKYMLRWGDQTRQYWSNPWRWGLIGWFAAWCAITAITTYLFFSYNNEYRGWLTLLGITVDTFGFIGITMAEPSRRYWGLWMMLSGASLTFAMGILAIVEDSSEFWWYLRILSDLSGIIGGYLFYKGLPQMESINRNRYMLL